MASPCFYTAKGGLFSLKAALKAQNKQIGHHPLTIAIAGVGHVGAKLVKSHPTHR